MVKINFSKKNDLYTSLEVRGHSNLSAYGTDIVCSAISSTTLMVLNGLIEVQNLKLDYEIKDGYVYLNLHESSYEKAQILLKSLFIYLDELQKQYPKNLKIKIMEV